MKKFFSFFSIFIFSITAFAQQKPRPQLSGIITDQKTGFPLAGATVSLPDSRMGTSSDSTGHYVLRNVPAGHTIIEISYAGYKTVVDHVDITSSSEKNFILVPSILENEGITVTGVAGATSIRKSPVPVTRVSKTALLATPSTNIIDALTRQPGVSQLSTGPAVSKPVIRGLGYNRLVTVNDGVRQEGQQWGDEHGIEIDENSVSRVEILKGPASLIYGSDAIAGVVNIITTAPLPLNTVRANVFSSYQTNNKQRSFFANIGGNNNGFNWNSKFNERNFGGYVGYNGGWGFSHLIVSSFNQRLGVIEGDRDAQGRFVKQLPGGQETAATDEDFNSINPLIPFQHIRHFKVISDNSFRAGKGKITLNLGWQRNQRQEYGNADNASESSLYFDLHTFNYNVAYHLNDKNGWTTSVGVNGMAQNNANLGAETLIPEYSLFDIGAFIYSQKTIGKATLSGGIRYDNRRLDSKQLVEANEIKFGGFTKHFSNMSGSAGMSFAANDHFTMKLNLARGFRAPSIPELATNGAHEGTNRYEYGDNNLTSETTLQGDLGVEWNSEHLLFSANAFYNHINNFIFYSKLKNGSGTDSLVNVDGGLIPAYRFGQHTANLYGFEAVVDLHPHPLDWLHWENRFSYVRGKFTEAIGGSENVPFIPAARLISELRAEIGGKGKLFRNNMIHFEADHTFNQEEPFTAFGTETATEGYTLLNAGLSTNISSRGKTLFSVYLIANNLADIAYQNHLSRLKYTAINPVTGRQGIYNTGRNFVLKINVPIEL
jgi:iron complex outermembrane receptor protein